MSTVSREPDHSRDDAGGRQSFDEQRSSGEVFRKPLRTQLGQEQRSYEDDREAHAGDRVHNRGMRKADSVKDQKGADAIDEAVDEVPELAAWRRLFGMLEYLKSPLWTK